MLQPGKAMKVRVLIVDDSRFFRNRLSAILAADPLLEVVGGAGDGEQAVAMNRELRPDVITMDVEMPVMNGIEAVRRIMRERGAPILMLSSLTRSMPVPWISCPRTSACWPAIRPRRSSCCASG